LRNASQGDSQNGTKSETAGSRFARTPRKRMSRMPTQKVGTLSESTLCALVRRPMMDLGARAPKNAIGTDSSSAKEKETKASWTDGMSRLPIALPTSSRVMYDCPRSPWTTLPIHVTYCARSGRSSPIRARS
jgi:hypothetical protein